MADFQLAKVFFEFLYFQFSEVQAVTSECPDAEGVECYYEEVGLHLRLPR